MRLLLTCLLAALALGATPASPSVSGKWNGSIDLTAKGQSNRLSCYAEFTQEGATVTGTFGPDSSQQFTIDKGAVADDVFSFEVAAPVRVFRITLTIVGEDRLQGDVVSHDQEAKGHIELTRVRSRP